MHPSDMVQEFNGVIGQNGEVINAGYYVQLSSDYQEVCTMYQGFVQDFWLGVEQHNMAVTSPNPCIVYTLLCSLIPSYSLINTSYCRQICSVFGILEKHVEIFYIVHTVKKI